MARLWPQCRTRLAFRRAFDLNVGQGRPSAIVIDDVNDLASVFTSIVCGWKKRRPTATQTAFKVLGVAGKSRNERAKHGLQCHVDSGRF
jgi:hypothetical protein